MRYFAKVTKFRQIWSHWKWTTFEMKQDDDVVSEFVVVGTKTDCFKSMNDDKMWQQRGGRRATD